MAKEGAEKVVKKDVVIEPKGTDSLTPLLEEDAKNYMVGHPAAASSEEEKEEKEEKDLVLEKEKELTDKEKLESEEEKRKESLKPKYKSQEEAETAYAEAQRKMHEATTESARLREQNEKLQAQFNEVLTKAVTKKEDVEKPPDLTKKEEAILKGRIKPMLKEIEALDNDDPDYQEKVDEIYDKHLGATMRERDARMEKDFSDRLSKVKDEIKKEIKEERSTEKTQDQLVNEAIEKAKKEGLDMRSNIKIEGRDDVVDTADWRLFWDSAERAPKGSSPEQIVDYAIKEVKRMRNEILAPKDKAKKRQEENAVLERTTVGKEVRPEDEVAKPISMTEALNQSIRRI